MDKLVSNGKPRMFDLKEDADVDIDSAIHEVQKIDLD